MPVTNNDTFASQQSPVQESGVMPRMETSTTSSQQMPGPQSQPGTVPNAATPSAQSATHGASNTSHGASNTSYGASNTSYGNQSVYGLSAVEMSDPNSIQVTVSDNKAPLVVLFGPPACGKTMTLVRLTRFLQADGYAVSPIRTFRPAADANYAQICNNFNAMMNSQNAASATDRVSFMLVEVMKDGRRLCQILEAPGEYYFNPEQPEAPFPTYVNTIIASANRKIWTIMVEPDWKDQFDRLNYVRRITHLRQNMRPQDSTIFVFNKIDKTNFVRSMGNVNVPAAISHIKDLFPGIFKPFENKNPVTRFWKSYNCDFVPFQTGFYTESIGGLAYQEGPQEYCQKLWNVLRSKISG